MSARMSVALLALLSGCGPDPGLYVSVATVANLTEQLVTSLEVTVVASQNRSTDEPFACVPASFLLPSAVGQALELPAEIVIHPGADEEWRCVAVRVVGYLAGRQVIASEELYCPDFGAVNEETLLLHPWCHADYDPPPCADEGEVCRVVDAAARCIPSPVGAMFTASAMHPGSCSVRR